MQRRHWLRLGRDGLSAVVLVLIAQAEVWLSDQGGRLGASATVLAACGAVAWRRHAPLVVALTTSTALAAATLIAPDIDVLAMLVALVVATYSLGSEASLSRAVLGGTGALGVVWCAIALSDNPSWGSFAFVGIAVIAPLMAGRALQDRDRTARELRRQSEQLGREQEARAREAVAVERARIARELHDIVAHSVSIMGVQASAGRRILDHDAERARHAFAVIEQASRQALSELQRMLGVLRTADNPATTAPTPTLRDLPQLVETMSHSGLRVALRVEGDVVPLAAGVELTAFRIAQESLTNVLKHAPDAQVDLLVAYRGAALEVEVRDDGNGATSPGSLRGEPGYGLIGIHERVSLYGGELNAGPLRTGGFAVRARLPLADTPK